MTNTIGLAFLSAVVLSFPAAAQTSTPGPPPSVTQRAGASAPGADVAAEMKKIDFLAGVWKGESWIVQGPDRKVSTVTENIQWKQNGRLLVMEGLGKRKADRPEDQVTVHDALGIVFYDAPSRRYMFHAYRDGAFIESELKPVGDRKFEWGFREPRSGGRIRFTIDATVPNRWLETGEYSPDEKAWQKFFEMTLQRTP